MGVNKCLYSILYFIRQEIGHDYEVNPDLTIREILNEESFDELDFLLALLHFEMNHGINIPNEWMEFEGITLRGFAVKIGELPMVADEDFPLFYEGKMKDLNYLIETVRTAESIKMKMELPN